MSDYHRPHTTPKAVKPHRCDGCHTTIPAGEQYARQTGFFEGRAYTNKFHNECLEALSEDGNFEFSPGSLEPPERLTKERA